MPSLFLGTIGLHDHVHVPLREGENELLFAFTEWFGGWGGMAKVLPAGTSPLDQG